MAAPSPRRLASVWFMVGIVFLIIGITNRRLLSFTGVGAAFLAIGLVQSRKPNEPTDPNTPA